jgi:hypothetical protein
VANRNSELFHHPDCKSVKRINAENITAFNSIEHAMDEGSSRAGHAVTSAWLQNRCRQPLVTSVRVPYNSGENRPAMPNFEKTGQIISLNLKRKQKYSMMKKG